MLYEVITLGDWVFVAPEDVPEDFSKIPEDASISSVLVSVPGTEEAKEAKYEQHVITSYSIHYTKLYDAS